MLKAHIVISPDPQSDGLTVYAICGAEIPNATWQWSAVPGSQPLKELINPITTCSKCYRKEWMDGYIYLAVSGELAQQERSGDV